MHDEEMCLLYDFVKLPQQWLRQFLDGYLVPYFQKSYNGIVS